MRTLDLIIFPIWIISSIETIFFLFTLQFVLIGAVFSITCIITGIYILWRLGL